ncbi:MAG TPA: hypothetical protein VGQ57_17545 [Polyangiaceae bacterium]|jgi:hypothetical protein|nr:hypothetical protein [Polyangiaceae bacterium]
MDRLILSVCLANKAAGVANTSELIDETLAGVPRAVESVGAERPPGFPEAIFSVITGGLTGAARQLARARR